LSLVSSRLATEISRITSCLHLDRAKVIDYVGKDTFSGAEEVKLVRWLAEKEEAHKVVVYECDPSITAWTKLVGINHNEQHIVFNITSRRCIRQADCLLLVGWTDDKWTLSEVRYDLIFPLIKLILSFKG